MKNRLLKRIIGAAMALSLTGCMLAGCGSKPAETPSEPAPETETKAEPEKDETEAQEAAPETETESNPSTQEATLKIAAWDATTSATVTPLIEGFENAHPNIKVEIIDIASADYTQKLTVMLNGGNDLDVVWIKDGDTTPSIAARGQLEDLTPYIERDGIDLSAYNGVAEMLNMGGKQVALPISTGFYILYYPESVKLNCFER